MRPRSTPTSCRVLAIAAAVAAASSLAHAALMPVGDEFEVATNAAGFTSSHRVAVNPEGGFRVVWAGVTSDSGGDVYARDYDKNGVARGEGFIVHAHTTGAQGSPALAVSSGGDFLVAWSGDGDGEQHGSFARLSDADGTPKADEFLLHDATLGEFAADLCAADDRDGFIVAWHEPARVAGIRLDPEGNARGTFESPVEEPQRVAVDGLPGGEFVVVWSSSSYFSDLVGAGYSGHVDGRRFESNGTASSGFQVNGDRDDPTGYDLIEDGLVRLSIAADARGSIAVGFDSSIQNYVYNSDEQVDGYNLGAQLERFVDGVAQGAAFLGAEPETTYWTDVAMTPGGNSVAVFGDDEGVAARVLDCHGADNAGGVVRVHSVGGNPTVAVNEAGDVVVVWQQSNQDGESDRILARRFQLTEACALCGDADVNGRVTAADALSALRTSVGLSNCAAARCDTGGSEQITASDALRILRAAVADESQSLSCA